MTHLLAVNDAVTALSPPGRATLERFIALRVCGVRRRLVALLETAQALLDSRDDDDSREPWAQPENWWRGEGTA